MPAFNVSIDDAPREVQDMIFCDMVESVSSDSKVLREHLEYCADVANERLLVREDGPCRIEIGTSKDGGKPVYLDYGAVGQAVISFALDAREVAHDDADGNWLANGRELFTCAVWALCGAMRGCGEISGIMEAARHMNAAIDICNASGGAQSPLLATRDLMEFSRELDDIDGVDAEA